jgi:hypothetical protein
MARTRQPNPLTIRFFPHDLELLRSEAARRGMTLHGLVRSQALLAIADRLESADSSAA